MQERTTVAFTSIPGTRELNSLTNGTTVLRGPPPSTPCRYRTPWAKAHKAAVQLCQKGPITSSWWVKFSKAQTTTNLLLLTGTVTTNSKPPPSSLSLVVTSLTYRQMIRCSTLVALTADARWLRTMQATDARTATKRKPQWSQPIC